MIDSHNFFDQPAKNNIRTYESIRRIAIVQGDDYTTGCLLDYTCLKENYKLIAIDLSKHQALNTYPNKKEQINFTRNLHVVGI